MNGLLEARETRDGRIGALDSLKNVMRNPPQDDGDAKSADNEAPDRGGPKADAAPRASDRLRPHNLTAAWALAQNHGMVSCESGFISQIVLKISP
jgi:hypothetical protein